MLTDDYAPESDWNPLDDPAYLAWVDQAQDEYIRRNLPVGSRKKKIVASTLRKMAIKAGHEKRRRELESQRRRVQEHTTVAQQQILAAFSS